MGPVMFFHVSARACVPRLDTTSPAVRSTLDEMRAEGIVVWACTCTDGSGFFVVVEAGDADEAESEIQRLARAAEQPLTMTLTGVRPA
jgi:hypothetical protein